MQQWRLVADSSCDLAELGGTDDHIGFATVPLTIRVGETDYVDVPSTDSQTMLAHMKEHKGPSSSCCPAPTAFAEEFRRAANTFAVTITSGLSGTYNCAMQAMHMVMEEHPDRHIHVIDSRATAGCMVLILRHLRELIEQGLCFDEIVNRIERYRNESRIIFSLASFDNLVKNGRMSRTSGLLASALNIRAVSINSEAGQIQVLEKPRGEKKAIERMVALMGTIKDMTGKPVVITHCNNPNGAKAIQTAVEETYRVSDVTILETGCLTSYYAGDQGLLLCF